MSDATIVLLIGIAATGTLLLAQWRLVAVRPEQFRTERLRGALYLALLFASFAILHRYVADAERPKVDECCLRLFGEEEPPPPGSGAYVNPPPAPPRPPDWGDERR
jgi:hypothetical protein